MLIILNLFGGQGPAKRSFWSQSGDGGGEDRRAGKGVLERVFGICKADPKRGREASSVIHPQSPFATGPPPAPPTSAPPSPHRPSPPRHATLSPCSAPPSRPPSRPRPQRLLLLPGAWRGGAGRGAEL